MCALEPPLTDRPLCKEDRVGFGWGKSTGCGLKNFMAFGCHWDGLLCIDSGSGVVEDGSCQGCSVKQYSSREIKLNSSWGVDPKVIPRPADSPGAANFCRDSAPGRICEFGVSCSFEDDRSTCPPRCPIGSFCPAGVPKPVPCELHMYQDETGQGDCKSCPTGFTFNRGSERLTDCVCPPGFRREPAASFNTTGHSGNASQCAGCAEGMQCDWEAQIYAAASGPTASLADWVNSRTKRQSVPYIKLGYWASAETPSKVVRCHSTQLVDDCVGGDARANICKGKRGGRVCAECPAGYQAISGGDGCEKCNSGADSSRIVCLAIAGLIILFLVHRVGNVQDTQEKLSHLASVSACGLLLQFVQTLTAFNQLKVDWGEPFGPMLDALSIFAFRFDLIKMQCIVTGNPVSSFRV